MIIPSFLIYFYQVIIVNSTQNCFLNTTAGIDTWKNCGIDKDFITTALLPFNWITGGQFSMIVVSVILIAVYVKYQKVIYPMIIGVLFLPIAAAYFPAVFINWAIIMGGVGLAAGVYFMWISQTNES